MHLFFPAMPDTSASIKHVKIFNPAAVDLTQVQPSSDDSGTATVPSCKLNAPFVLASAILPILAKIVLKIQSNQFVNMKDLLPDNVALLDKLDGLGQAFISSSGPRPHLWEVTSILSWASCLFKMIAIQSAANPDLVIDMCTYGVLILREASKHGGNGWSAYDALFHQHTAACPSLSWASSEPSIHVSTFLASHSGGGDICTFCSGSDHSSKDCALGSIHTASIPASTSAHSAGHLDLQCHSAQCHICNSWNRSKCAYGQACNYRHICATCQLPPSHQAKDCKLTPTESIFKRPYSASVFKTPMSSSI